MRKIDSIILHCSATAEGKDFHADDIDRWHRQKGWNGCGYHYVIPLDGSVERGRSLDKAGAHCSGHNAHSVGICYVGGLAKDGKTAKDTRTPAQKEALYHLVEDLMYQLGLTTEQIYCHNEFANKACPCFGKKDFVKEFLLWTETIGQNKI